MRQWLLIFAVLLGAAASFSLAADEPKATEVYASDFPTLVPGRWVPFHTGQTPEGARPFLGTFWKKTSATLRLNHLPPHQVVRLHFHLLLLYGVAGGPKYEDADLWSLSIAGGPTLLRTTFDTRYKNPARKQSFPDDYPAEHPAGTDAAEQGTLGYHYAGDDAPAPGNMDLVYHCDVAFPHTGDELEVRFSSDFGGEAREKEWALESVKVETLPNFVARDEKENKQLWDQLIGRDAMAAWSALWQLAEGGPKTLEFVAKQLGAGDAEERGRKLAHDLTVGDALSREKANAKIDDLAPGDMLLLRAAVNAPETPESLRAKLKKLAGELAAESPVFTQRVTRLLRVLGGPEAKRISALLEGAPLAPPEGPLTLAWQNSHAPGAVAVTRCVFTPDGKMLLTTGSEGIREWQVDGGKCVRLAPQANLRSLAISPDGATLAAGTLAPNIYVWSLPDWKFRQQLKGHKGQIWSLLFTRDSKLLWSGAQDGIRCWDLATLQQTKELPVPAMTRYLASSPDGKLIVATENQRKGVAASVTFRNGETGEIIHRITDFHDKVNFADISPDGKTLAVAPFSGNAMLFDIESKKKLIEFREPSPEGECATFSPDGKFVCVAGGGGEGTAGNNHRGLHIYRIADGAEVWRFNEMHKGYCAAFSPDGKHLAATDDEGGVYLWDIKGELDAKGVGK